MILNRLYVEKKLAKREGNYSEILEQSQDGTLVTDERGNIEIWNEGMDK